MTILRYYHFPLNVYVVYICNTNISKKNEYIGGTESGFTTLPLLNYLVPSHAIENQNSDFVNVERSFSFIR